MTYPKVNHLVIPILMYHSVKPSSEDYLTVSVASFCRHLEWLTFNYQIVRLSQVLDHISEGHVLPAKPLLLSFDDGLIDNLEHAVPVLKQFRASAIFFIVAGYIGQSNAWNRRAYCFEDHLRAADLKNLADLGFELGNHSLTHHRLTKLSDAQLAAEFVDAHQIILEASWSCR